MSRRKIMRDVRIRAHLCPFLSRGIISCFVTRLTNHSWRVESWLVIHRLSRDGSRRAGNVIEMRISGIPRRDGLENWSKKLKFMVRSCCNFIFYKQMMKKGYIRGGLRKPKESTE
uniref:Uncharacterized protein n=1 Tax=Zonotrichia albicollis TaxID=44394 RepID=A0A8D2M8N5_ZONAL